MFVKVKLGNGYKYLNSDMISDVCIDDCRNWNNGYALKLIMSNGNVRVHSLYETLLEAQNAMDNLINLFNRK